MIVITFIAGVLIGVICMAVRSDEQYEKGYWDGLEAGKQMRQSLLRGVSKCNLRNQSNFLKSYKK